LTEFNDLILSKILGYPERTGTMNIPTWDKGDYCQCRLKRKINSQPFIKTNFEVDR